MVLFLISAIPKDSRDEKRSLALASRLFCECKLNTHRAAVLKDHCLGGTLTDAIIKLLMEADKNAAITLNYNKLKKYFPNVNTVRRGVKASADLYGLVQKISVYLDLFTRL